MPSAVSPAMSARVSARPRSPGSSTRARAPRRRPCVRSRASTSAASGPGRDDREVVLHVDLVDLGGEQLGHRRGRRLDARRRAARAPGVLGVEPPVMPSSSASRARGGRRAPASMRRPPGRARRGSRAGPRPRPRGRADAAARAGRRAAGRAIRSASAVQRSIRGIAIHGTRRPRSHVRSPASVRERARRAPRCRAAASSSSLSTPVDRAEPPRVGQAMPPRASWRAGSSRSASDELGDGGHRREGAVARRRGRRSAHRLRSPARARPGGGVSSSSATVGRPNAGHAAQLRRRRHPTARTGPTPRRAARAAAPIAGAALDLGIGTPEPFGERAGGRGPGCRPRVRRRRRAARGSGGRGARAPPASSARSSSASARSKKSRMPCSRTVAGA